MTKFRMFEFNLSIYLINEQQIVLVIEHADKIRTIFFNKIVLGKLILQLFKFAERKIQITKLTIPEDIIIPITPKLKGNKFPILLIGAPSKNQSKKTLRTIPAKDN